jgi:AraC-like DNA-binding protein
MLQPPRLMRERVMPPSCSFAVAQRTVLTPFPLHWHDFYEVQFTVGGEGVHEVNGRSYALARGNVSLLTPTDFHAVAPRAGSALHVYNATFSPDFLGERFGPLLHWDVTACREAIVIPNAGAIEADFARLVNEAQQRRPGYEMVARSLLEIILVEVCRCSAAPALVRELTEEMHQRDARIQRALLYLHDHFREEVSIADTANYVRMSPHYFSACFHSIVGSSYQRYLQDLRLEFSSSLLSSSSLSVTAVCYASGFNTLARFDRAFMRKFGMSPRSYRRAT